jgi:hypothetical protein
MAPYLSAWDSLPNGPNVVRMMTVIRSGYASLLCTCCTSLLAPADALQHILIDCSSFQLISLRTRLRSDLEAALPQAMFARIVSRNLLCEISFLLFHVNLALVNYCAAAAHFTLHLPSNMFVGPVLCLNTVRS